MGNGVREARRSEALSIAAANRADKNAALPHMERPCGTPGAIYSIIVEGAQLGCIVELPFDIETSLPAEAKDRMKENLHDAILPIIERFYRDVWVDTIAGKTIADDPEPMPRRWELLFTKWLKRCFERDERPVVEGRALWSVEDLPAKYRWWL